jgi:hypothetical protein
VDLNFFSDLIWLKYNHSVKKVENDAKAVYLFFKSSVK